MDKRFQAKATEHDLEVDIVQTVGADTEATEKLEAFRDLFLDRYTKIRRYLQTSYGFDKVQSLEEICDNRSKFSKWDSKARAIVMVIEAKKTASGYLRLVVEDPSGELDAMVSPDVQDRVGTITVDDIIAVEGNLSKDGGLMWVRHALFPHIIEKERDTEGIDPVSAAFISDVHIGANNFLTDEWEKMLKWLKSDDPIAQSIGYLVVSGDIVDGVGVYPNQDEELAIHGLYDQYKVTGEYFEDLPEHIEPVILPGNHDAVRLAEPQPVLSKEVQSYFNAGHFVGNPCRFTLGGVDTLSYHGKSIDDMVMNIKEATYENPEEAMKQMLKRRHLAPQWGVKNQIASEPQDLLTIENTPEIFVTGHTHGHCLEQYQGVQMVVSSTWQGQTSFQRMVGFEPKPAILSVVKLDDLTSVGVDFGG
jgi:DNA polymerase II small subunit